MALDIRVLGPLEIALDGEAVRLGGRKQRAVLALLVIEAGRLVSSDRLLDEIWGDETASARSLQVYVSELRHLLRDPGRIRGEAGGYRLTVVPHEVDASRFAELAGKGRERMLAGDPAEASRTLRHALSLWRGRPYADLEAERFVEAEAARLEELRLVTTERCIAAELALGHHDVVIPEIEALVTAEPLREGLRRQLMLALYRAGRQADALAVYHDARQTLLDELGLEPGPELRELEGAILRQEPSLDVEPAELAMRRRLPAPATPLVGRRREVETVRQLLTADARLVTVTGPGGTGKTRIALQAAHELAARFTGGVVFVGLASLRDPEAVPARIATALGVVDGRDPLEAVADHLGIRPFLLLIDNFEQVDDASPVLAQLLAAAPKTKLLVTSRHRLRLYGENEFPLGPLELETEAMPLFVRRAAAAGRPVGPGPDVRDVCVRLDRLPLAIELAAARVRELTPAMMLATLPRLYVAAEGPRDVPERQRTLEAAIAWSYDLLEVTTQRRFAALAAFAGGFTADAALAVADASAADLDELVRRSLVNIDGPRFTMLETIREFAVGRLADSEPDEATRRRHARWFFALAQEGDAVLLEGGDSATWLQRLETEHDNLRAALEWSASAEPQFGLALALALGRFWEWRGHIAEGQQLLDRALAGAVHADTGLRARALVRSGVFAHMRGDLDGSTARLDEALAVARAIEDPVVAGRALRNLGNVAKDRGDHPRAQELHEEARRISAEAGDELGVSASLMNLADVSLARGDDLAAARYARESVTVARGLGHDVRLATSLLNLGLADLRLGQAGDAAAAYDEALMLCERNGYGEGAAYAFIGVAAFAEEHGEHRVAARMLGAADEQLETAGAVLESTERPLRDRTLASLRAELGPTALEAALAEGRALALPDAIAEARRLLRDRSARADGSTR